MILKRLIKIAAIFAVSCSWAQEINVDIKKSKLLNSDNKFFGLHSIVEDGNEGFVTLREFSKATFTNKRFYQVEFYDKTFKMTKSFELDFSKVYEANREDHLLGLIVKNGFYSIVVFQHDSKSNQYVCSVSSSKLNENKFTKKELFVIEEKQIKVFRTLSSKESSIDDGDLHQDFVMNENKDAFAIIIDVLDKVKESKKIFVFDLGFNKIADYVFEKNIVDENCRLKKIILSNNKNDVFLMNEIERDSKKEKKELGEYYYDVSKISEGNKISSVQIKGEGKDQFDIPVMKFNNNSLYFVAYYYGEKEIRKGLAVFEYNANDLVLKSNKFNLFTDKLISEKLNAKGKVEWHPIRVNDVYFDANGLIVCSEEYYEDSTGSGPNSYYFIVCADIFVDKVNFNNEVYWEGLIKKRQVSKYAGYMTSKSFLKDGDLYFLSNVFKDDKLDHRNLPILKLGRTLSCFKIDKDGKYDYKELIGGDNRTSFVQLGSVFSLNNNKFLFMGSNIDKNEYQYYKITF